VASRRRQSRTSAAARSPRPRGKASPPEAEIRTVIVSTDLSEMGNSALPLAFRWARDRGAALVVLHVLDYYPIPNPVYGQYYPIADRDLQKRATQKARAALRARLPADLRKPGRSSIVIVQGDPAREILRVASQSESPALVIASHGRTGLARFALGSVAERVIRAAHCPVLVVR
jgi:nucleotide-binding universal stress UspA family protein